MRRKILLLGLACLSVTGCQTANQTNGAVGGGVIGGLVGLGVGAATRNPAAGLAIGAGTGALVGTAVGANKDRQEAKAAQAYAAAHPPLSLTEVVSLSHQGVPDDQIIRQMASSNSLYNLTSADLSYLNNERVSPSVIAAMQQRVPGRVVVGPPPPGVVVYQPYPPPPPVAVGVGVGIPLR
jgi:hypothetical protein